jgi:dTDP-4-dehydrorhamnose reductase
MEILAVDTGSLVLVTGASGLLGANLVLTLLDSGFDVAAASRRWLLRGTGIDAYRLDLDDPPVPEHLVAKVRPRWVIHCAALTDLDRCEDRPCEAERTNVDMSRRLAEAAARYGARFIYISTDSVFDGSRGGYSEADPPNPVNQYARSKLLGELAVREALPQSLIVRVNIFGWNAQPKRGLAEWILDQLEKSQPFPGFQDVVFNPLLVNDLGDILVRIMRSSLAGLFHLGSEEHWSKFEFARGIAEVFGLDPRLVRPAALAETPLRTPRPRITTLSTGRAQAALAMPMPSLWDSLERFRRFREAGMVRQLGSLLEESNDV